MSFLRTLFCFQGINGFTQVKIINKNLHFKYNIRQIKVNIFYYRKNVHKSVSSVSRVQPLRVLSKRPGELLCVFSDDTVEWIDVEAVEDVQPLIDEPVSMPIIKDVGQWIKDGLPFVEDQNL